MRMRAIGPANVALGGLNRRLEQFERAAAAVVEVATSDEGFEPIHISTAARRASETMNSTQSATLEGAMVDMRVAKYAAVANLRVIETEDDLARTALEIVR